CCGAEAPIVGDRTHAFLVLTPAQSTRPPTVRQSFPASDSDALTGVGIRKLLHTNILDRDTTAPSGWPGPCPSAPRRPLPSSGPRHARRHTSQAKRNVQRRRRPPDAGAAATGAGQ